MDKQYQSIYLSPHLDDVVLSCGGQIYQQALEGNTILVVTVTAGDPPAEPMSRFAFSLHERWQLVTKGVEERRIEDVAACDLLGADHLHWDLADCIYRRHPSTGKALYQSEADIFGQLQPAEAPLVTILAERMAGLPAHDRVLVPLVVGHHLDHQLTRLAAEQWLDPAELTYYEDYPYVQNEGALAIALSEYEGWHSEVIPLTTSALEAKMEAITCYRSQVSTFFYDRDDLASQVVGYARSVGGERLWNR